MIKTLTKEDFEKLPKGVLLDLGCKACTVRDALEDAERYRWLLANYAFGDGYKDIDAALNDGEADKYLSAAIDAARKGNP